jgi:hypothetical protein
MASFPRVSFTAYQRRDQRDSQERTIVDDDDGNLCDDSGTGHTQHRPQAVMLVRRPSLGGPNPSTPERAVGLFELLSQQIREAAPLLTFATVLFGAGMMVSWSLVASVSACCGSIQVDLVVVLSCRLVQSGGTRSS